MLNFKTGLCRPKKKNLPYKPGCSIFFTSLLQLSYRILLGSCYVTLPVPLPSTLLQGIFWLLLGVLTKSACTTAGEHIVTRPVKILQHLPVLQLVVSLLMLYAHCISTRCCVVCPVLKPRVPASAVPCFCGGYGYMWATLLLCQFFQSVLLTLH